MKSEITSDQQLNLVDVRFMGILDILEMKSALKSIIDQPDWKPGKSIVFDYSDLDFTGFSSKDMQMISDLVVGHKNSFGRGKWAFIISNDLQFGLMRVWEMITEDRVPMIINLFKNRLEAQNWIIEQN